MQRETKEVALIVSTPALAGPGQPEAPPSPHLDRWHVKTTPARFPRAGPCPRCPAVQVTTPSPCPSLSTIAQRFHFLLPFLFLTLSIPSDLHSQSPTPSSHRALPCSDPKAPPPTTHLASSGPTRRSVQAAAEAHRPDLATRRSGEFRTAPSPKTPPHQQPGRHLRRPSAAFPQARAQEERRSPPR